VFRSSLSILISFLSVVTSLSNSLALASAFFLRSSVSVRRLDLSLCRVLIFSLRSLRVFIRSSSNFPPIISLTLIYVIFLFYPVAVTLLVDDARVVAVWAVEAQGLGQDEFLFQEAGFLAL